MQIVTQGYGGVDVVTQGYGVATLTATGGGGGPPSRPARRPHPPRVVELHEPRRKGLNDVLAEEAARRRKDVDIAAALWLLED